MGPWHTQNTFFASMNQYFNDKLSLIFHRSEFWHLSRKPAVIISKWLSFENYLGYHEQDIKKINVISELLWKQERHTVPWPRANNKFSKISWKNNGNNPNRKVRRKEDFPTRQRKIFQLEKGKHSNWKKKNIPVWKRKIFQLEKWNHSN